MKKLFVVIFIMISMNGLSQQKFFVRRLDDQGVIKHLVFNNSESYIPLEKAEQLLRDSLKLQKKDKLILVTEIEDELGFTHRSYEQYYNGIKVEDGRYGVCSRDGKIEHIYGEFKKIGDVNIIPIISEKEALEKALDYIKANRYSWQISSLESEINIDNAVLAETDYPKGEIIICKDVIKTNSIYRLAYKFEISAVEPISQKKYYVDAITGAILNARDLTFYTSANGTTLYSGTVNIETVYDPQLSMYKLYETRTPNNIIIHTFNADDNSTLPPPVNIEITNNSTTWSEDSAAIDAHWGTEKVIDYWWSVRGRNSLDNSGMAINSYVHYGSGTTGDNAFWSNYYNIICYGDGFYRFKPTVSLDFVAHETAHGIMKYTGVFQSNKENPSLNEGFSDIWGAVIEHWATPK